MEMSLKMWKNRCDLIHGCTEQEKLQKRREKIKKQVLWCYNNRHLIPFQHHPLFRINVNELCKARSPYYLQKWADTFEALRKNAMKDYCDQVCTVPLQLQDSDGSISTQDLDEYLLDVNDGMDVEGSMAAAGIPINSKGNATKPLQNTNRQDQRQQSPMHNTSLRTGLGNHGLTSAPILEKPPWSK